MTSGIGIHACMSWHPEDTAIFLTRALRIIHFQERLAKESGQEPDEQRLIEAAQKDPARFAELYEINFERVYAFIVRRVQDRIEAQDLTSDVFHQALANLGRFEWRGTPFAAWLFRIAA